MDLLQTGRARSGSHSCCETQGLRVFDFNEAKPRRAEEELEQEDVVKKQGKLRRAPLPRKASLTIARILGKRIGTGQRQAVRGFECRGPSRKQTPERISNRSRWAPQPTNAGLGG